MILTTNYAQNYDKKDQKDNDQKGQNIKEETQEKDETKNPLRS